MYFADESIQPRSTHFLRFFTREPNWLYHGSHASSFADDLGESAGMAMLHAKIVI